MNKKTLLEFPCDFPLKVIGQDSSEFAPLVLALVQFHAPDCKESDMFSRPSKDGKYLALTIRLRAKSQAQLDNIYKELHKEPSVLMVL